MEYWITNNDMNICKVIQNGNSLKRTGRDRDGRVIILPLTIADEHIAVQRESKARTTLLQSIPDDHVADFHYMDDARDIWNAVKARFGGNAESKKMRKSMLKQEFSEKASTAGVAGEFALMGVTSEQHKASYKAITVMSSISEPLQLLHMDLFGPTSIKSIDHKYYCLVITDDYSRFCWVFFLEHKDETYPILKDFINLIENQLNKKVKAIRCDNGTKLKNAHIIELCGSKGIKKGAFEMSAMGELTFFLGLQVQQRPDGIFISQD
ncbi:putative ribonuclease H-like domain-containing protein, partial [Tanacetum coccineum]